MTSAMLLLQNGYTPLHIAAKKNELEVAQLLLDQKADAGALSKVRRVFVCMYADQKFLMGEGS